MIIAKRRYHGLHYSSFGLAFGDKPFTGGVNFTDDWVAEVVTATSSLPNTPLTQGYMHDQNGAPVDPFPAATLRAIDSIAGNSDNFTDQEQSLYGAWKKQAQDLVTYLCQHPPHSGNVMGIGDTDAGNDSMWRSKLSQLVSISRKFVDDYNRASASAGTATSAQPSASQPGGFNVISTNSTSVSPQSAPAASKSHLALWIGLGVGGLLLLSGVGFLVLKKKKSSAAPAAVGGYRRRHRRRK